MLFDELDTTDLATFTSLISGYAQSGQGEEAIKLYLKMQDLELKPESYICSSLLKASAILSAYEQGKQIHVHTLKSGLLFDVHTSNSLVNMYARCGSIEDASRAFFEVPEKGIVSWSTMIGGLAQHGHEKEALSFFDKMLKDGIAPNNVTLASVLSACNHAGLVTQAETYFETMEDVFGIKPTQEHYACMIDILARSGKLNEVMDLLSRMPFEANASVWGAVLGAARTHKNVDLGQRGCPRASLFLNRKNRAPVLFLRIYTHQLVYGKRLRIQGGDRSHSMSEEIFKKLGELMDLIREEGYVPVLENDLHNVARSEKEVLLLYHSEKLAVAFGLIATPPRAPIRVKKNLRVCIDCHTFLKFVSKVVTREIIVRDINRFHHFRDGNCSCGDYW
ncbi:unnamed protein product [Lactuca saligna]|uniref:DYW domain-containing protein n=1 Tax=Lactuca saligna TaxID=75948 RepID=A0AA35VTE0_LACSI|nr:unnamed protein product [Lactuca saligna]